MSRWTTPEICSTCWHHIAKHIYSFSRRRPICLWTDCPCPKYRRVRPQEWREKLKETTT